jgi:hypothetical protein
VGLSGLVGLLECPTLRSGAGTLELLRGVGRSGRGAAHFAERFGSSFVAVGAEAGFAVVEVSAGLCHFRFLREVVSGFRVDTTIQHKLQLMQILISLLELASKAALYEESLATCLARAWMKAKWRVLTLEAGLIKSFHSRMSPASRNKEKFSVSESLFQC